MQIQENVSLKAFNTFGVEQRARYFAMVTSESDLLALSEFIDSHNQPLLILGGGSNLLLSQDFDGLVARIALAGISFSQDEQRRIVRSAAGENWHQLVMQTIEHGWPGLENLALIPGSVGAAPIQNIGAYGIELDERFDSLTAYEISTGKTKEFNKSDCQFSYRDSVFKSKSPGQLIITEVRLTLPTQADWRLDYAGIKSVLGSQTPNAKKIADIVIDLRQDKLPDPNEIGNAGSFFKNPMIDTAAAKKLQQQYPQLPLYNADDNKQKISAAWLIESCGLKGYREGDAGVSEQHALVIVNHGNAKGSHILAIAERVRDAVHEKFGIELEPEPNIV